MKNVYLIYMKRPDESGNEMFNITKTQSEEDAENAFWQLRENKEFWGQEISLTLSKNSKEFVYHRFDREDGRHFWPLGKDLNLVDKHRHVSRRGKMRFDASFPPDEAKIVQAVLDETGWTKRQLVVELCNDFLRKNKNESA